MAEPVPEVLNLAGRSRGLSDRVAQSRSVAPRPRVVGFVRGCEGRLSGAQGSQEGARALGRSRGHSREAAAHGQAAVPALELPRFLNWGNEFLSSLNHRVYRVL